MRSGGRIPNARPSGPSRPTRRAFISPKRNSCHERVASEQSAVESRTLRPTARCPLFPVRFMRSKMLAAATWGDRPMSLTDTTQDERELIFASFEDPAMGAVAEKALREWERQVESITLGN